MQNYMLSNMPQVNELNGKPIEVKWNLIERYITWIEQFMNELLFMVSSLH